MANYHRLQLGVCRCSMVAGSPYPHFSEDRSLSSPVRSCAFSLGFRNHTSLWLQAVCVAWLEPGDSQLHNPILVTVAAVTNYSPALWSL